LDKNNHTSQNPALANEKPTRIRRLNADDYYVPFLTLAELLARQEQYVESFQPKDNSSGWVLHKLRLSLERTRSIARAQDMGVHNAFTEGDLSVCSCALILNRTLTEGVHLDHRSGRGSWEIDYSTTASIPPCKKPCNCLLCDGDDPGRDLILAIAEQKELLAGSLGLGPAEQQELFLSQASVSKLSASELEILSRIQSKVHESDNQLASAIDPARKKSDPLDSLNTLSEERGQ
jgi:hypothetical protein